MSISELLTEFGGMYFQAVLTTYKLTVFSFAMAILIGVIVTVMRICPIKPLRLVADFYVQIFRNIPGAALLILLVYALPYLDLVFSYFTCVLMATTMIPSAFCSEYLMSGINTIAPGQIEAARSLGMTFFQISKNVIMPQAARSSVLPLTNLMVATMLTTAIASQVPLSPTDLTGIVDYINTHAVGGVTAFVISAFFYCVTSIIIGQIGAAIDRKVRILR